jgi:hypothetical protein
VGAAAIGGASEFAFESDVGGVAGKFEVVWADAASAMPHTSPAAIRLHAAIRLCSESIVLLERGDGIAGSLECSTASEYACR